MTLKKIKRVLKIVATVAAVALVIIEKFEGDEELREERRGASLGARAR